MQKKAFQFDSLIAAQDFWQGVEAASGQSSGYGRSGRLQPIADEKTLELARARAIAAQTLWQGKATWQVMPRGHASQLGAAKPDWLVDP